MTRRNVASGLAVLTVAAVLAGCANAKEVASSQDSTPTTTSPTTPTATTPTDTTPPDTTPTSPTNLPAGFGDGPPGSGLQRFYHQQVDWQSCGTGEQCANVWVPLDYKNPGGSAITLALKKKPATGTRQGSLFINPGGPGASGVDYVDQIQLGSDVTSAFDVVGFDPRGVGKSTPIDCLSDSELDTYVASDPTPDDQSEIQQMVDLWKAMTDGCRGRSGPLMDHMSTVEVAKDLDVLRALVGDDKLNYFGASYGTYIGATYAAEYPLKVGRMVLDGAVDPGQSPKNGELSQAKGFEGALDAYLKNCVQQGCPFGSTVGAAKQKIQNFLTSIDSTPLDVNGRKLTEGEAFLGIILPLYNKDYWSYETSALRSALAGDGSQMLYFADQYTDRQPDGTYSDNAMEAQSAVNCLDHPESESLAQIEAGRSQFLKASPTFGPAAMWWPYACSNWPAKAEFPQPDFHAKGAAPIVVVGTTRDPATPYQQAVDLSKMLDSGVLLSRNGDGHTAYGMGNSCIDTTIDNYLVNDAVPPDGKRC